MSSSKILAARSLLPLFRPTLGTHSPAYGIAESRHVTDMAAIFTVCLAPQTRVKAMVYLVAGKLDLKLPA